MQQLAEEIQVDGGDAIVIDGLPGFDSNRLVITVRNDRLYKLASLPWQPSTWQVTPLEQLDKTIIRSMHCLPPAFSRPSDHNGSDLGQAAREACRRSALPYDTRLDLILRSVHETQDIPERVDNGGGSKRRKPAGFEH